MSAVTTISNPVVGGYSDLAATYDSPGNLQSCWGTSTARVLDGIQLSPNCRSVADIGCGTGHALAALAARSPGHVRFVGVEPADQMRERAAARTGNLSNVSI